MSDSEQPDPPLDQEQQKLADSLPRELINKIDMVLLSHARKRERKVAMLVGLAMQDESIRIPGLPDIFYVQRVKHLVEIGSLVAEGNLDYMRYSEVKLP